MSRNLIRSSFEFPEKCLFVFFYQWEFFCLRSTNTCLMFSFQKRKMSMELCRSFIGGKQRGFCLKNHNFQVLVLAPCLKFQLPESISQSLWLPGTHQGAALLQTEIQGLTLKELAQDAIELLLRMNVMTYLEQIFSFSW